MDLQTSCIHIILKATTARKWNLVQSKLR